MEAVGKPILTSLQIAPNSTYCTPEKTGQGVFTATEKLPQVTAVGLGERFALLPCNFGFAYIFSSDVLASKF